VKKTDQQKIDDFVENHPDAELWAFFSTKSDGALDVVVLARKEEGRGRVLGETVEYTASTPEELIERAREGGFEIGDVETVREKCEPIHKTRRRRS